MTRRIQILSEQTIDQIAAGEVIENPASVVKELLENAVDAGALRIIIEILGGGFQSIRISDDGCGMSEEDALLCLKRHATSKIKSSEDLMQLRTMGFRGEALASIAAISQLTLTTAEHDGRGIEISVKGGEIISVHPSARSRGTTIEVRSLFFNVPARKKFQKTAAASSAEITRVATILALAHPYVAIELTQQRRAIFSLPGSLIDNLLLTVLQKRSAELLGAHFESGMHPLHLQENGYELQGIIGAPSLTRYNRSGQYLFVNSRPVSCFPLAYAVQDGYGTRIEAARYPIYVIHAKIDPALIDVNVHPQKKEIRLQAEESIKAVMRTAVKKALERPEEDHALEMRIPSFMLQETAAANHREFSCISEEKTFAVSETQTQYCFIDEIRAVGLFEHYLILEAQSALQALPQLTNHGGVIWVDLRAAEARILFERLMNASTQMQSQKLLLPLTFSYTKAEAELLQNYLEELNILGFELRCIGPTVFMVESIPASLMEGEVKNSLDLLLSSLIEKDGFCVPTPTEKKIRRCAEEICRVSRSRKHAFTLSEAMHVFKELATMRDPLHCPQGKPTLYHLKKEQIDDYFHA